jgi:hypothetical protein
MKDEQIRWLADQALNEACRHIQDVIGIDTGDVAGMFFSGDNKDQIEEILREYISLELQIQRHEFNEFSGEEDNAAQ